MKRKNGFTIVDLVATISVLGIVVTIAIPAFSKAMPIGYGWMPSKKTAVKNGSLGALKI